VLATRIAELKKKPPIEPAVALIDNALAAGKYEVTFDEYDRFAAHTGRALPDDAGFGRGKRPVINVSWNDAVAYALWLSTKTGKRYRLPTEEEWEKACGMHTEFCGSDDIDAVAWYFPGTQDRRTHPVGEKRPNQHGLYDMTGNVREWIADCGEVEDCRTRLVLGGAWDKIRDAAKSTARHRLGIETQDNQTGFRLVQDVKGETGAWTEQLMVAAQWEAEKEQRKAMESRVAELKALPPIEPVMVPIDETFAIGKYEVTFDEYDRFAAATGRPFPDDAEFGRGKRPVFNVTSGDAGGYIHWLSQETGKSYNLPTEEQWEKACGMQTDFCGGNDADAVAWHRDNSGGKPHPVGEKQPNQYGLYDMSGNVWEMISIDSKERVARGGSWLIEPSGMHSPIRISWYNIRPDRSQWIPGEEYRNRHLGFRLVQNFKANLK
jgi:formylglycine-generating enzyme required for sulfatase activity